VNVIEQATGDLPSASCGTREPWWWRSVRWCQRCRGRSTCCWWWRGWWAEA